MECSAWIYMCAGSNTIPTPYCSSAWTPNRNSWDKSTYSVVDSVLSAHQNRRLSTQAMQMRGRQLHHWPFNHGSYLSTAAAAERSKRSRQGGSRAERKILLTDCQRRLLLFSIISRHWNQNLEKALIFAEAENSELQIDSILQPVSSCRSCCLNE